jgi:hypothetical protein
VAVPGRDEFRRAAELAGDDALKLRAGDALHLAIAESLSAQGILCLDDAMIESAKSLGMNVVTVCGRSASLCRAFPSRGHRGNLAQYVHIR